MAKKDGVLMHITPSTRFIISTSGRLSSLMRYKVLLQDILNVDVAYMPINNQENGPIDPSSFANTLRGMNCIGGAISRDIKHTIIPYLDEVEEFAAAIGSVNTVIVKRSKERRSLLQGYNTDALGFRIAIENALKSTGIVVKSAICYGYGGVTSVVVQVLKSIGVTTYICGRRMEEAGKRAAELGAEIWNENVTAELLVNAAPVTDKPLENAANLLCALRGCKIVFDHEMPGNFMKEYCSSHAIHHIPGYDMYYPQMYSQWSLFLSEFGIEADQIPTYITAADQRVAELSAVV